MTDPAESAKTVSRKQRKEEGRLLKRKRIEVSGGVRPRVVEAKASKANPEVVPTTRRHVDPKRSGPSTSSRFGRVMSAVPCRNKPRTSTLSIAVPGSVLSNCQTKELRTHLIGQIARFATIYHVDEIVVYDDKLDKVVKPNHHHHRYNHREARAKESNNADSMAQPSSEASVNTPFDPNAFMARILQYCECPQYLRRHFFPMHPDLQFAGLIPPLDAPHHVRAEDHCKYREGVVLPPKPGPSSPAGSLVNCGVRQRPVEIETRLMPGIRCTIQLEPAAYKRPGPLRGQVVAPSAPREDDGTYWGYTTRLASSLQAALDECPYSEQGYDLKIGTSERANQVVDRPGFQLPLFRHALIVFGGVAGIEECVDADESMAVAGQDSASLFDRWINVCRWQGSRTIRTEEAVLITLTQLRPFLDRAEMAAAAVPSPPPDTTRLQFSDDDLSEESD